MTMHGDTTYGTGEMKVRDGAAKKFDGLLLIDGVKSDRSAMEALDRKNIKSVEVIKGAAAEKLSSDPAARNGIIRITTKQ